MCGIIGYTGRRPAQQVILDGLSKLEYRGYDSSGILTNENGKLVTVKRSGRLENLCAALVQEPLKGTCGMGHTRWATHGAPTDVNAHPHGTDRVKIIHNGIIENYIALANELREKGFSFESDTDTEIAACYVDSCYEGDPIAAIVKALHGIEGSYALSIMFADFPDQLFAVRKDGPLIIAPGNGENFLASDVTAIVEHTNRFFTLEYGEIAILSPDEVKVIDFAGNPIDKQVQTVNWDVEQAQKTGYDHFMLKEINEQPEALLQTIKPRLKDGLPHFEADGLEADFFKRFGSVRVVACGTAMHAGLVGRDLIEQLARIPVQVEIASEFRYRDPVLANDELIIIVSQSGETADSLAALRLAKERGITTLAIVNVAGSSISREADYVLHTYAGPEIAVASTKAYTVQLAMFYLLSFSFALSVGKIDEARCKELVESLLGCADAIKEVLVDTKPMQEAAKAFVNAESLFFLGRNLDYALACEGALKLKEISYIHCAAYGAGELKHGTISLITDGVPIIALATQQRLCGKMLSNIREVRARGAFVLLVAKKNEEIASDIADILLEVEPYDDMFMPFSAITTLQVVSYYVALARGCDIDKPRNLAKSVTVE